MTTGPRGTRLRLGVPEDYVLSRDACSYGYFLLWPNNWDPDAGVYSTTIDLDGVAVLARVRQRGSDAPARDGGPPGEAGAPLSVQADAALDDAWRALLRARLSRMLRLDEPTSLIAAFHAGDPRWTLQRGGFGRGRLMRSPTFFEDVLKTVTSCNVAWPSTIRMNRRLCEVAGRRSASGTFAFPTAERLARTRPATLRARCSVGYRDARIVALAKMFARGEVDEAWFADPRAGDDEVYEALLEWPGVGPYAAANIMQLLGRHSRLPADSETLRHCRVVLGWSGSERELFKRAHAHFAAFGAHAFRAYWFELWAFYEKKKGPSWRWRRETDGASFTAAQLKELAAETPADAFSATRPGPAARTRARG